MIGNQGTDKGSETYVPKQFRNPPSKKGSETNALQTVQKQMFQRRLRKLWSKQDSKIKVPQKTQKRLSQEGFSSQRFKEVSEPMCQRRLKNQCSKKRRTIRRSKEGSETDVSKKGQPSKKVRRMMVQRRSKEGPETDGPRKVLNPKL